MARLPMYDRQVTTQGVGAGPVNLPETTTDLQMLNAGAQAAANATEAITRQVNDGLMQDNALRLDTVKQNLFNQVRQKQGSNAFGSSDEALGQFDQAASQLGQAIPQTRRQDWERQVSATRLQLQNSTDGHEYGEMQTYRQGQLNGQVQNGIAEARSYYNSPENYAIAKAKVEGAIGSYASAQGWSPEQTSAAIEDARRQMAGAGIDSYAADFQASQLNFSPSPDPSSPLDRDSVWSSMIFNESRGRQLDGNGNPLTSSAGAVGIAQVMPATAQETARRNGIEWDENRFLHDASYNENLGRLHMGYLAKKYDGNMALAVSAYNAGEGAVDGWVGKFGDPRKGQISDAQFIQSIPFDETRAYTASALNRARALPSQADMRNIMGSQWYQDASPQQKSQLLSRIGAEVDRRRAYQQQNLSSLMTDDITRMRNGLMPQNSVSRDEYLSTLPTDATPQQIEAANRTYDQFQMNSQLVPTYNTMMTQSAAASTAAVEALKPNENTPNYSQQLEIYQLAATRLNQINSARESDPGGWLMKNSPMVQSAMAQYQQNPASGAQLISSIMAEKQRLGIKSKDVLPDAIADQMVANLQSNNETTVDQLQATMASFGAAAPAVVQQLQKKGDSTFQAIMAVENPRASVPLWQNRNVKTSELKAMIDAKGGKHTADSAVSEWNNQSMKMYQTLALQPNGNSTWASLNDAGQRLTMINMQRGMPASDAAKQAYTDMFGSQYDVGDTYRVPKSSGFTLDNVDRGVELFMKSIKADELQPMRGLPNESEAFRKQRTLYNVQQNGRFVTNSDETGLVLYVGNNVQNDASGNPITVSFADMNKLAIAHPGIIQKALNVMNRKETYTPGTEREQRAQYLENLRNTYVGGQSQAPDMATGLREANANLR